MYIVIPVVRHTETMRILYAARQMVGHVTRCWIVTVWHERTETTRLINRYMKIRGVKRRTPESERLTRYIRWLLVRLRFNIF